MKTFVHIFASFICFALAGSGQLFAAANLLINPGFENVLGSEWTWTTSSGAFATTARTTASKRSGSYGFDIRQTANAVAKGYLEQTLTGLTPGATYTVSGYMFFDGANLYNRPDKYWTYIEVLGGGAAVQEPAKGANVRAWTQYTLTQTADGSGNLTVRLYMDKYSTTSTKTSNVYFDDLVVEGQSATPTKLAFTAVPGTGNAGVPFNVTVQSQDGSGNPANVSSDTTVTLSKGALGSGSLGGTTSGVIANGDNSVTISGVTYDTADTMTLTATPTAGMTELTPVSSDIAFTVPPQTLDWGPNNDNWTNTDVWYNPATSSPATYNDTPHDNVVLEDTHSGTSPITITLDSTVSPGSVNMTASKDFTISGPGTIAGAGGLSKDGGGKLTLSTANTFSGDTRIVAGTLVLADGSALQGSTLDMNGADSGSLEFAVSAATLGGLKGDAGRDLVLTNSGSGGGVTLTFGGSASTSYLGNISGPGSLIKTGSGTVTVGSGPWTYDGDLTVSQGILAIGNSGFLPSGSGKGNLIVNGAIHNNGVSLSCNGLSGTGTLTSSANYSHVEWIVGNNDATSTFSGTINRDPAKSLHLKKVGAGTLTLSGNNAIGLVSGGTAPAGVTIVGGKIVAANAGALGSYSIYVGADTTVEIANVALSPQLSMYLTNGSTLLASGGAGASYGKSGYPYVDPGAGITLATAAPEDVLTFTSGFAGGNASSMITAAGPGSIVLSNASTYTGNWQVSGGTLLVHGSLGSGTVLVQNAATLGGTGTVGGPVTIANGGILSPGASLGTLTLGAPPSLGGTLAMEINPTDLSSDKLVLSSGTFTYGGTLALTVTAGTLSGGEAFDLFDFTGTSSGSFTITTSPPIGPGLNWWQGDLATTGVLVLNRPPVGGAHAITTRTNLPIAVSANKLKAGDSDPDSNPLSITAVSDPQPGGASVGLSGGVITYDPGTAAAGSGSFKYTLEDGHGGSVIVTVSVAITDSSSGGTSPNLVYGPALDGADFVARFAGIPGQVYTVESAASPTGPWVKKANYTAPTDNSLGFGIGVFEVRQATAEANSGYYRTVYPAY